MDRQTRARLEAAGFRVGDAEDFLNLTDDERLLVELRLAVSRAVRRRREQSGVTQQELASKLKSSQSRVAKIEAGSAGVSLDLSFRALFAAGGGLSDLTAVGQPRTQAAHKGGAKAEGRKRSAQKSRPASRRAGV